MKRKISAFIVLCEKKNYDYPFLMIYNNVSMRVLLNYFGTKHFSSVNFTICSFLFSRASMDDLQNVKLILLVFGHLLWLQSIYIEYSLW